MDLAWIILKQAILMLLLNVVGIIAYRTKVVDKNGGRQFSNFVLEIVTPVLVVNAYADVEYESRLVLNAVQMPDAWYVSVGPDMYNARAVVLAAGVARGKKFAGEAELLGRGVSYCATCDGMLYRGKPVAVVGYTDTARQEAEFLQKIGCSVTYFDRPKQCEIRGDGRVESVTCDGRTIPAEGVFILRPTMAPTELFPGLAVEQGYVTVDRRMATNLPGLFAAGDCTGGPLQVSKAAGDGLIAGQSAAAWAAAQERREKQS